MKEVTNNRVRIRWRRREGHGSTSGALRWASYSKLAGIVKKGEKVRGHVQGGAVQELAEEKRSAHDGAVGLEVIKTKLAGHAQCT